RPGARLPALGGRGLRSRGARRAARPAPRGTAAARPRRSRPAPRGRRAGCLRRLGHGARERDMRPLRTVLALLWIGLRVGLRVGLPIALVPWLLACPRSEPEATSRTLTVHAASSLT